MPIYEYYCEDCQKTFEAFQSINDDSVPDCKFCQGNKARKLISPVGFVLKGAGFYANDYPSESRKKAMESEKNDKKKVKTVKDTETKAADSTTSSEKTAAATK